MVIDVKTNGRLLNSDTIVFNSEKNCWEAIRKVDYFSEFVAEISKMIKRIDEMEASNQKLLKDVESFNKSISEEIETFKTSVNQKLKEHHNALSILVGNEGEDLI